MKWAGLGIAIVMVGLVGLELWPLEVKRTTAVEDKSQVSDLCQDYLAKHDYKPDRVVILLHGFTNCPKQFVPLAQKLYMSGDNVYIPRLPYHGYTDRLSSEIAKLDADKLAQSVTDSIEVAGKWGNKTVVVGLSGGAVMAGWAGQNVDGIDKVVLIAPNFAYWDRPLWIRKLNIVALLTLPNLWVWWDDKTKDQIPGPQYAYPRFSSRAVGQIFKMGYVTTTQAREVPPKTLDFTLVLTEGDKAISRQAAVDVLNLWSKNGTKTEVYEFPKELNLPHDMIDVNQPNQRTDVVYAKLMELVRD